MQQGINIELWNIIFNLVFHIQKAHNSTFNINQISSTIMIYTFQFLPVAYLHKMIMSVCLIN